MNCWHCNHELIWGGDDDLDEDEDPRGETFLFVSNLSCPNCGCYVEVYYPKQDSID